MNYIKRLPANMLGRDFVCGDIHGSYSCVERALKELDFDESVDRFICSGDLVDRGPENEKCMELLYKPWFHMVKGNHEQLMEDFFGNTGYGMWWAPNCGSWGIRHAHEQSDESLLIRATVTEIVSKLPYLLTVEKKSGGVFHVLHAELSSAEPLTDADLADEDTFRYLATQQSGDGDTVTWGRWMFMRLYRKTLTPEYVEKFKRGVAMEKTNSMFGPDLSHIYSGHTIVKFPVQFYGQTNLDTCAYGSYSYPSIHGEEMPDEWCALTVTEPETGRFWQVNDRMFKEVVPVIINGVNDTKIGSLQFVEARL